MINNNFFIIWNVISFMHYYLKYYFNEFNKTITFKIKKNFCDKLDSLLIFLIKYITHKFFNKKNFSNTYYYKSENSSTIFEDIVIKDEFNYIQSEYIIYYPKYKLTILIMIYFIITFLDLISFNIYVRY